MTGRGAPAPLAVRAALPPVAGALARYRRPVAALCAAGAVAAGLHAARQSPSPLTGVVVTTHDLAAGAVLGADDLAVHRVAPAVVPAGARGATSAFTGRTTAGPVRRGELLTDVRVLGRSSLAGYGAGRVATPVRIADAGAAALARPGERIDVLVAAAPDPAGLAVAAPARVVAAGVTVITSTAPDSPGSSVSQPAGALLVLATTPAVAIDLAGAAASGPLSVVLHGS